MSILLILFAKSCLSYVNPAHTFCQILLVLCQSCSSFLLNLARPMSILVILFSKSCSSYVNPGHPFWWMHLHRALEPLILGSSLFDTYSPFPYLLFGDILHSKWGGHWKKLPLTKESILSRAWDKDFQNKELISPKQLKCSFWNIVKLRYWTILKSISTPYKK